MDFTTFPFSPTAAVPQERVPIARRTRGVAVALLGRWTHLLLSATWVPRTTPSWRLGRNRVTFLYLVVRVAVTVLIRTVTTGIFVPWANRALPSPDLSSACPNANLTHDLSIFAALGVRIVCRTFTACLSPCVEAKDKLILHECIQIDPLLHA